MPERSILPFDQTRMTHLQCLLLDIAGKKINVNTDDLQFVDTGMYSQKIIYYMLQMRLATIFQMVSVI